MSRRGLFPLLAVLFLASLACSTLTSSEAVTSATATPLATPTLAPTAPVDSTVSTPLAGEPTSLGGDPGTPGSEQSTVDPGTVESQPGGESTTPPDSRNGGGNGDGSGDGQGSPVAAGCPTGGTNLLANPSFEGQYKPFGAFTELNHAPQWFPWWKDGENNLRPEFKPAEAVTAPNRVHSGNSAQQYFKSFGMFKAGVYQSVLNVTPGSRLQFSAYGQAWSCEEFSMCPDGRSVNPADMFMRVGIDPTGGTNWESSTIKWSDYFNPLDQWQIACVEAMADSDIVSVFLWASPNGPRQNQDVYWDDASLVVLP